MNSETLLNAVIFFFGFTKKQAKEYIKHADEGTKTELLKGYNNQCKKALVND